MMGSRRSPDFYPNPGQHRILEALLFYHYFTIQQVQRLHFNARNYTYVSTLLKELVDNEYLQQLFLDRPSKIHRPKNVYTLASIGYNYLADCGFETDVRYRPSEEENRSKMHLRHTLEVNEFFISAELLERSTESIRIRQRAHERQLRSRLRALRQKQPIPDGFLDLAVQSENGKTYSYPIVLELDRATEEQAQFRRKVRALLAWYEGGFKTLFGCPEMMIAVATTGGPSRLRELVQWTEAELREANLLDQADRFYFTDRPIPTTEPTELFFQPIWRLPFQNDVISLLE